VHLLSELSANAVVFFLLCFRVAMATIGRQADLRPALFDNLFLAAACRGTTWDGSASSGTGQLRHGYHRTRRVRREVLHSRSGRPGGEFSVRLQHAPGDCVWGEVEDAGSEEWDGDLAASAREQSGLFIVMALAWACGVADRPAGRRAVWFCIPCQPVPAGDEGR